MGTLTELQWYNMKEKMKDYFFNHGFDLTEESSNIVSKDLMEIIDEVLKGE
jgi:hypothetical protein